MHNYNLTKMATQLYFPGNVAQLDDAGLPSIMVYIPAFKNSDVLTGGDDSTHPAFIVNGKEIPGFYYSKYQNIVHNGAAYSLPAEDPQTSVNFDEALAACEAKGNGWHLSTAAEWAAIALWCKKNAFLPYGNNYYGKDIKESEHKAVPTYSDSNGQTSRVATGTGPLAWSHDSAMSGIWDMNGNGWERLGGFRLVWGEVQVLTNNDAADTDNPQNATSTCWKAINAADGSLVEPESRTTDTAGKASGNTVKLDYVNNTWTYSTTITTVIDSSDKPTTFGRLTFTNAIGAGAVLLLKALALLPEEETTSEEYGGDAMYWNNGRNECMLYRGGAYNHGNAAGVFSGSCVSYRNYQSSGIVFRAAYIPEISQEG